MRLEIPDWLRSALSTLNWDILGFKIHVGDTITAGMEWALDGTNTIADWAAEYSAWAFDFQQEVLELFRDWQPVIQSALDLLNNPFASIGQFIDEWWNNPANPIRTFIDAKWSQLEDWWLSKRSQVEAWIDTGTAWIQARLESAESLLNSLYATWDDFRSEILPGLASYLDVQAIINELLLTWSDLFNTWATIKDDIIEFFTDPLEWLWSKFADWFLGPE